MRSRLTVALAALSLFTTDLAAQRGVIGAIVGRSHAPDRPAEKPPQAPGIKDARYYNRYALSRFSLESAPVLTYMQTTGFVAEGIPANYWTLGDATQLSFRATPSLSVTSTFTSSMVGGPFGMSSAEMGLRVKPWTSPRFSPFAEGRMSWAFTSGAAIPSSAVPAMLMYRTMYGDFASGTGKGGLFAVGTDVRLTARYSMTTSLSHTHYAMRTRSLNSSSGWNYTNDATRLLVGLRYNHGRWMEPPR